MSARGRRRWGRRVVAGVLLLGLVYGGAGYLTSRLGPAPSVILEPLDGATSPAGNGLEVRLVDPAHEPLASWLAGAVEVRGVLSVHSERSHDAEGTLDEVAAAAARTGLDFVILGDHPGPWLHEPGALDPVHARGVLVVPGQEMVITETGRVLAVGLEADTVVERWEGSLTELGARSTAAGGYLAVVHGRSPRARERWQGSLDVVGIDGWETLDISEIARVRLEDRWAGYHITSFLLGLVTGRAEGPVLRLYREGTAAPGLLAYDSARMHAPLTLTAGLNHHVQTRIAGRLVPPYTPFFRTLVNHVLLERPLADDARRGRSQLLAGLRAGAVFVSLGDAAGAAGFRFGTLDDETLVVRLPPASPGRYFVRLLRDGHELGWIPAQGGAALTVRGAGPGSYRVEVARAGVPLGRWRHGLRPWILSNAVEVGVPALAVPALGDG